MALSLSTTPLRTLRLLTPHQREALDLVWEPGSLFIHGRPGTGKSTVLQASIARLLEDGCRPDSILVLLPQRQHIEQYERALVSILVDSDAPTCGGVDTVTFYGFCRRAVALYWPVIAAEAGFADPAREPVFLTIETAQYYMWRIVEPLMSRKGYFSELAVRRGRLLSQLIDNLNKSALVGFSHTEIATRLSQAWTGGPERLRHYEQAQECAIRFREHCLAHNLVDLSLACELFRSLMSNEPFREHFRRQYRFLVVDNVEENVPAAHDMIRWAMDGCTSSVLAMDTGAGYRLFLGADPEGAHRLGSHCERTFLLERPVCGSPHTVAFAQRVSRALGCEPPWPHTTDGNAQVAVRAHGGGQYWNAMMGWVAERVRDLVSSGVAAGDIAVVAPYVSDVMRFVLTDDLATGKPPVRVYPLRPAQPFREHPTVRAVLTLAWLAHPHWRITVLGQPLRLTEEDVALALRQALDALDPVRASMLAQQAYDSEARCLRSLTQPSPEDPRVDDIGTMWEGVGFRYREPYEMLCAWLEAYRHGECRPLHVFLSCLFDQVLTKPGFTFFRERGAARVYGRVVESAAKFAEGVGAAWGTRDLANEVELGQEYVSLILGDIAGAEYLLDRPEPDGDALILAPAHAYLTRDLRSRYQFWVDLSSQGWFHRPNQPLTHPIVLSRRWPVGRPWHDSDENEARRTALVAVLCGLAARCTDGLYLASSQYGLGGEEQSSLLERAVLRVLTTDGRND